MFSWKTIISTLAIVAGITTLGLGQKTDIYNLDETYSLDREGTVYLETGDAEVEIRGTDRKDAHLVVHYRADIKGISFSDAEKFEMLVNERNGDLRIHEKERNQSGIFMGYRNEEYTVVLEVPRSVALKVRGDDDNYVIEGIDGDLTLDVDDADMEIRSGDFRTIDISGEDGDLELQTVLHDDGRYRIEMDDGDISFHVAGGGGEFRIDHDNVNFRVDDPFERRESGDEYTVYRLAGGAAIVRIDADDGTILLGTR